MPKRDFVLLNYTGYNLTIEQPPAKNTPKGHTSLYLGAIGKPKFEYKNGILLGEELPYQIVKVTGITPPIGTAIYIVMPEVASVICCIRNDVYVPVDYYFNQIELHCRTIARFSVEGQTSWM
jgi:hypothetical protein